VEGKAGSSAKKKIYIKRFLYAYAAYWLANHKRKVFGDDQDGFITIPIIDENRVRDGRFAIKYPRSLRIAARKPL
jgi:hypothetical protein